MKKIYIDRLKKIAEHLKYGKLGHKKFDFDNIHVTFDYPESLGKENKNFCGWAGCAIGEFPIIFPRSFRFVGVNVRLIRKSTGDIKTDAEKFVKLKNQEIMHLFFPYRQIKKYGGTRLYSDATKTQVANNILKFIKYKEKK